jgi:hypothetical protein
MLFVKQVKHQQLPDPEETAVCYRCSRCHAQRLACEASLTKKLSCAQRGDDCFFALLRDNRKLHFAFSNIEYGICSLSLIENAALGAVFRGGLPAVQSSEQAFPIHRRDSFSWHDNLPLFAERGLKGIDVGRLDLNERLTLVGSVHPVSIAHEYDQNCSPGELRGEAANGWGDAKGSYPDGDLSRFDGSPQ